MSLKFALPLAAAAACLPLAGHLHADTYAEVGDAGDLPATAQVVSGPSGTALTAISGALTLTNGVSDSDLFEIYINSPSTFSASLTGFAPGVNTFDSQLMLFSAVTGKGIEADDDDPNSSSSSANLPSGSTLLSGQAAGLYYLLVSGSGRYATSAAANGLIFPNFTDGTTDPTVVQGPTAPGGGNALTGYTGNSNEAGKYNLVLAGAQFVPPVPEPGAWAFVVAGAAGLAVFARSRRSA